MIYRNHKISIFSYPKVYDATKDSPYFIEIEELDDELLHCERIGEKFNSYNEAKEYVLNTLLRYIDEDIDETFEDGLVSKPPKEFVMNKSLTEEQSKIIEPFVDDDGNIDFYSLSKVIDNEFSESINSLSKNNTNIFKYLK